MKDHIISEETILQFRDYLIREEKSEATIQKYLHEVHSLKDYLTGKPVEKQQLIEYRKCLQQKNRATTVNGKLSAINSYLQLYKMNDQMVKLLKVQRNSFLDQDKELTEAEYKRLLKQASGEKKERLYHLLLTICSTGIRVSEVQFITVKAVEAGKAEISMKGKNRVVLLPQKLIKRLKNYIKKKGISDGPVFCTRTGRAMDRSNICHEMKALGKRCSVQGGKVHPHSLRHLFARQFYEVHKNIAHLADVLGHSSIETTRIYVAVSAMEHVRTMETMNLVI